MAVVVLLMLVAVAAIVASGGGEPASDRAGAGQAPGSDDERGTPPPRGTPAEGVATAALSPAQTVTSFYERAAADDYAGAWALAGAGFREQIGSFEGFRREQSTLESIDFEQAEHVSQAGDPAVVAIRTVATHTDGVDRCQGTVSLARGGPSGWLIDRAGITCPESTRGGGAPAEGARSGEEHDG